MNDSDLDTELRLAIGDLADLAPVLDTAPLPSPPMSSSLSWRSITVPIAAGAVAAAGIGLVVVNRPAGDVEPSSAAASNPVLEAEDMPPPFGMRRAPGIDVVPAIDWFLPTTMSEGYELVDLRAHLSDETKRTIQQWSGGPWVDGVREVRWADPDDPDDAWVTFAVDPLDEAEIVDARAMSDLYVHGYPANLTTDDTGPTLRWSERGVTITIRAGQDFSGDDVVAVARAQRIGNGAIFVEPATMPKGYQLVVDADQLDALVDAEEVRLRLAPSDGSGAPIEITIRREGVDRFTDGSLPDGSGRVRLATYPNGRGSATTVVDDWLVTVTGPDDADRLRGVAASIGPASADEAAAAMEEIARRAIDRPQIAAAELSDATEVSVHEPVEPDAAPTLCLLGEVERCVNSETSETTDGEVATVRGAWFGNLIAPRYVAWSDAGESTGVDFLLGSEVVATSGVGSFIDVPQFFPAGDPTIFVPNDSAVDDDDLQRVDATPIIARFAIRP